MIHTKEPANVFYVFLTAYRSHETEQVNEIMLEGMTKRIQRCPGLYGNIESYNEQGCFKEAQADSASIERTLKVRCTKASQVAELTDLACTDYDQDAVLVVNSQTHTASLFNIKQSGEYPDQYPVIVEQVIGTFTQVDAVSGEHYTRSADGSLWEVL